MFWSRLLVAGIVVNLVVAVVGVVALPVEQPVILKNTILIILLTRYYNI